MIGEKQINGVALCAGVGGIDLGLHIAEPGYRTVCFVEREAFAAAALVARMGDKAMDSAPIWDDIKTFEGRRWRGCVDIVTAGYPCQPFSTAGHRLGVRDPRHLWPHVRRIWAQTGAEWLFLENVGGHLSLGFEDVHRELSRLGCAIAARLQTAAETGASHQRERLFILAHRSRTGSHPATQPGQPEPADRRQGSNAPVAELRGTHVGLPEYPVYPPGPGERGRWADILASFPRLAPAFPRVRRMADGLADRLDDPEARDAVFRNDRIRAIGNGVVPLAAAAAYRACRAEIEFRTGAGGAPATADLRRG